jgi:transposase-like protein
MRNKQKVRPVKPACPKCRGKGYTTSRAVDGRPKFTCTSCGHIWTAGTRGGVWAGGGLP